MTLGPVDWRSDTYGFCRCPGEHHHTKPTKPTDCEVYVDEFSHVHCFHGSCEEARELASQNIRDQLDAVGVKQKGGGALRSREKLKKVRFEPEKLDALELEGMSREALIGVSTCDVKMPASAFLSHLYSGSERVIIFEDDNENQGTCLWPRETFTSAHPNGVWFLPQPVKGTWIDNPRSGRRTRRSAECVTSFRYLVAEADDVDEAKWLSYLVQLDARISAIYSSGGRSIHALIRVDASSKEQW